MVCKDKKVKNKSKCISKILSAYAAKNEDAYRLWTPYAEKSKDTNKTVSFNNNSRNHIADDNRGQFSIDIDKIIHSPFYNRYSDKTQVFSLRNNDDLTRRATHVQLVARMANIIGDKLGLNTDLIQAIALGHDTGHTPFGHAGESYLDCLYYGYTKQYAATPRRFFHNVHSVRTLMKLAGLNLTLQTYDGILFHNGEKFDEKDGEKFDIYEDGTSVTLVKWVPSGRITKNDERIFIKEGFWKDVNWTKYGENSDNEGIKFFEEFLNECKKSNLVENFSASTMEGCVVRICDILAYAYKDRQDAFKSNYWKREKINKKSQISYNEVIVQPKDKNGNTIVSFNDKPVGFEADELDFKFIPIVINDIIKHSGIDENEHPYLAITEKNLQLLNDLKKENRYFMYIPIDEEIDPFIRPIFMAVYAQMRKECIEGIQTKKWDSPIFKHHIFKPEFRRCYEYSFKNTDGTDGWAFKNNIEKTADEIVVDFIASMTDDYIVDLYGYLLKHRSEQDLAKTCFIKDKEKDSFIVLECNLLWDKNLYDVIKHYYRLSYFEEERKKQMTVLQLILGVAPIIDNEELINECKVELQDKGIICEEGISAIKNYNDDFMKRFEK